MKQDQEEKEANLFALFILMPEHLLIPELRNGMDMSSDEEVKRICKKFQVTASALMARIHLLRQKYPKGLPDRYGRQLGSQDGADLK